MVAKNNIDIKKGKFDDTEIYEIMIKFNMNDFQIKEELKLNIKDAYDLLNSAGYTFSPSILLDVIVKDYVDKKEFNMWKINDELDKHQQIKDIWLHCYNV